MLNRIKKQIKAVCEEINCGGKYPIDIVRIKVGINRKVFDKTILYLKEIGEIDLIEVNKADNPSINFSNLVNKGNQIYGFFTYMEESHSVKSNEIGYKEEVENSPPFHIETENSVTQVAFNQFNANSELNLEILKELNSVLKTIAEDDTVRTVILKTQNQTDFSTGWGPEPFDAKIHQSEFELALMDIVKFPRPLIAMINGKTIGPGFEIALACDFRFASYGVEMGYGQDIQKGPVSQIAIENMMAIMGIQKTKEMLFATGILIGGAAQSAGLVDQYVHAKELKSSTFAFAQKLGLHASGKAGFIKGRLNEYLRSDFNLVS